MKLSFSSVFLLCLTFILTPVSTFAASNNLPKSEHAVFAGGCFWGYDISLFLSS